MASPESELHKAWTFPYIDWHHIINSKYNMGTELFNPFVSSKYEHVHDKPLANVSKPINWFDERETQQRWAGTIGLSHHLSLAHFIGVEELVPHTHSYSNFDVIKGWFILFNIVYVSYFIGKNTVSQINTFNPRTKWAHKVAFWGGLFRTNLAFLVGCVPAILGYQFFYTYVPGLKINDPSLEGWKKVWKEGQSTFWARVVAMGIFPALGYIVWRGGTKKAGAWAFNAALFSAYYEWVRWQSFSGTRAAVSYRSEFENHREALYGSLKPNLRRKIDPDNCRLEQAATNPYHHLGSGILRQRQLKNMHQDYAPAHPLGMKLPNPYFNPLKAAQFWRDKPAEYKNDYFEMLPVLSAHTLSGAADIPVIAREDGLSVY